MKASLPGEVWKPMFGFEARYEISNLGRVWSIKRPHPAVKTGRIVACSVVRHGYVRILIDRKAYPIHRLVLKTFERLPREGEVAAHNNGNPSDNRLENLRWATLRENMADKKIHGTYWIGTLHKGAKLTEEQVGEIRALRPKGISWDDLGARFGVSPMAASQAGLGKTYSNLNKTYPPARRGRRFNRAPST